MNICFLHTQYWRIPNTQVLALETSESRSSHLHLAHVSSYLAFVVKVRRSKALLAKKSVACEECSTPSPVAFFR